jgi:hypothetical protein
MLHHDWRIHARTEELAHQVRRADAAVDVLMAVVVGVFAALALAHWAGWLLP